MNVVGETIASPKTFKDQEEAMAHGLLLIMPVGAHVYKHDAAEGRIMK